MSSFNCAADKASQMLSSSMPVWRRRKFSRTEDWKTYSPCKQGAKALRIPSGERREQSGPSSLIWPDSGGHSPMSRQASVVLPQPLSPMMASFSPGQRVKDIFQDRESGNIGEAEILDGKERGRFPLCLRQIVRCGRLAMTCGVGDVQDILGSVHGFPSHAQGLGQGSEFGEDGLEHQKEDGKVDAGHGSRKGGQGKQEEEDDKDHVIEQEQQGIHEVPAACLFFLAMGEILGGLLEFFLGNGDAAGTLQVMAAFLQIQQKGTILDVGPVQGVIVRPVQKSGKQKVEQPEKGEQEGYGTGNGKEEQGSRQA